jgi:hypothetical protein
LLYSERSSAFIRASSLAYQLYNFAATARSSSGGRQLANPPAIGKLIPMPELPDITAYITAIEARILGQRLEHVRIASAIPAAHRAARRLRAEGKTVRELRRIGKRIAIGVEGDSGWSCT